MDELHAVLGFMTDLAKLAFAVLSLVDFLKNRRKRK